MKENKTNLIAVS